MLYSLCMLRIYSGLYKGRRLRTVRHPGVRPTTAKVKMAFFDAMQNRIRETIFLDGFAGVGNVGIEALSRGAEYVVFIEELPECVRALRYNLEKIGIPSDHYRIIKGDYNRSVIRLSHDEFKFDLIFLDPPYSLLDYANPLKVVYKRGILKPEGRIILERPSHLKFAHRFFNLTHTQRIGNRCLDYFGNESGESENSPDSSSTR